MYQIDKQAARHVGSRPSPLLLWTLCGLLLAQQLLPLQAHTHWRSDGRGHVQVVCTLQPGIQDEHTHQDQQRSAAVAFSDLMNGGLPTLTFAATLLSGRSVHTPATPWREAAPAAAVASGIRAPPLS